MTFNELLNEIDNAGLNDTARFVISDNYGNWVFVPLVDAESGSDPFIHFFRDDDLPSSLGSPGTRCPAGSLEDCADVRQMKDHVTMRCRNPWNYPCRTTVPGSWQFHDITIGEFSEEDGYDVIVLELN